MALLLSGGAVHGNRAASFDIDGSEFSALVSERVECLREFGLEGAASFEPGMIVVASARGIPQFMSRLNFAGSCGFRLESVTRLPLNPAESFEAMTFVAVLRHRGVAYEYDWFEAFTPGEAQTRINHRAESGYYFRALLPTAAGVCDKSSRGSPEATDTGRVLERLLATLKYSYGGIYIVEREPGEVSRFSYWMVIGPAGWGKRPTLQLEKELNENATRGFRPVALTEFKVRDRYAFAVLMENRTGAGPLPVQEYRIFRAESGFEKKVRKEAEKGFEIIGDGEFGASRFALLAKNPDAGTRKYAWLQTHEKGFPEKLKEAQRGLLRYQRGIFRLAGCDFAEMMIVFTGGGRNKQVETKTIKIMDRANVAGTDGRNKSVAKELADLQKQGYEFKGLFLSDGVNGLFEREVEDQTENAETARDA